MTYELLPFLRQKKELQGDRGSCDDPCLFSYLLLYCVGDDFPSLV